VIRHESWAVLIVMDNQTDDDEPPPDESILPELMRPWAPWTWDPIEKGMAVAIFLSVTVAIWIYILGFGIII